MLSHVKVAGFFVGDPLPEAFNLHEQFDTVMAYLNSLGAETHSHQVIDHLKELRNAKKSKKFGCRGSRFLAKEVLWADAIILASPVHWFGLSLVGHAFIHQVLAPLEWGGVNGKGYQCSGKVVGSMFSYHELGAAMAASHFHFVANHMKMDSPGWSAHCLCPELGTSEDSWQHKPELMARAVYENARRIADIQTAFELEKFVGK